MKQDNIWTCFEPVPSFKKILKSVLNYLFKFQAYLIRIETGEYPLHCYSYLKIVFEF